MLPLVFEPFARPQIWGQRRLGNLLGKPLPEDGLFGESWEISDHPLHISRVAEGPLAEASLRHLCSVAGEELLGSAAGNDGAFPLLIKFLDCDQLLSVQVHPDDDAAAILTSGERGKTEAWLVLHAEPDAEIYAGLQPGVTADALLEALQDNQLERCLHRIRPNVGDCLYLPAGTVHTVGGGVLMAEVQQSSDATFRLYDWNRRDTEGNCRELHIEKSLAAINWQAGPVSPVQGQVFRSGDGEFTSESLVRCQHFSIDRYRITGTCEQAAGDRFAVWIVLSGQAELAVRRSAYSRVFGPGQTVLVPAASANRGYRWSSVTSEECCLLRVMVPELIPSVAAERKAA
jgi:mannose-6-phosphate isomerase